MVEKKSFLKKEGKFLLALFVILSFALPFLNGETQTGLNIPNAPPYLIKDIPDQSWDTNQNLLNAFDLDDYFYDQEETPLTYYTSSIFSINITIDPLTHEVSFFPNQDFSGERNVTFYASDSVYDSPSNMVRLYVGLDNSPPQWSSPSKSKITIYQNDIVSFYTNWTDDRALSGYIFSINQGSGWENYTQVNFSGTQNISSYSVQIRAPSPNTVYWRFYAFDTSGNMNFTNVQSFSVSAQQIPPPSPREEEGSSESTTGGTAPTSINLKKLKKTEDFELSDTEFKISIKQGYSKTRVLKITNTGIQEISMHLSAEKISDFIIFSEENFSILPGNSKEITIDFNCPERTIPGQYFGYIQVNSQNIEKSIPTVLDMQALNLDFDVSLNISKGYEIVKPGKIVKVNISIFNTKDIVERNATMYYAVKDYTGKLYNFSEENVDFFSVLNMERGLQIPDISPEGKYLFYVRVSDDKNIAINSVSFEVGTRINLASFFKKGSLLLLIILASVFISIFMVKYQRDKKKERLLELYIMLNKLKQLIKQNKGEEALKLFIKIKGMYHEPVQKEIFDDKERLKKEIESLYLTFAKESKGVIKEKELPKGTPSSPSTVAPSAASSSKTPAPSQKAPDSSVVKKTEIISTDKTQENKKTLKEPSPDDKKENDKK